MASPSSTSSARVSVRMVTFVSISDTPSCFGVVVVSFSERNIVVSLFVKV